MYFTFKTQQDFNRFESLLMEKHKCTANSRKILTAQQVSSISKQVNLILLIQCIPDRIQNLIAAAMPSISREFARLHDVAIRKAVASVLDLGSLTDRDKLLIQ